MAAPPAIEHAAQPVQGASGRAAHRFIAAEIWSKASPPLSKRRRLRDGASSMKAGVTGLTPAVSAAVCTCSSRLRQTPGIAVGKTGQAVAGVVLERQFGTSVGAGAFEARRVRRRSAAPERPPPATAAPIPPRRTGFGGRPTSVTSPCSTNGTGKGVLLGLVEAVDFIHEQDGVAPAAGRPPAWAIASRMSLTPRTPPTGRELRVEGLGHQPREVVLPTPSGPTGSSSGLARLEGQRQRFARPEQVTRCR